MIRKISIISFLLVVWLLLSNCVLAAGTQFTVTGEDTAKPGETKTITLKIASSDVEIGVVSGKIEKNSMVKSINVIGKNSWNLTYNQNTGVFNIYKAEGAKTEEILDIEYTLENQEGIAEIKITNINMATIEYEDRVALDISKKIIVKNTSTEGNDGGEKTLSSIKIKEKPSKTTYKVDEKIDITGLVVIAEYSDGTTKEITNYKYTPTEKLKLTDTKIIITYTEDGQTKTVEQPITVNAVAQGDGSEDKKDNTQANKDIDKAGLEKYTFVIITITIIVAFISYKKYKNYNNI